MGKENKVDDFSTVSNTSLSDTDKACYDDDASLKRCPSSPFFRAESENPILENDKKRMPHEQEESCSDLSSVSCCSVPESDPTKSGPIVIGSWSHHPWSFCCRFSNHEECMEVYAGLTLQLLYLLSCKHAAEHKKNYSVVPEVIVHECMVKHERISSENEEQIEEPPIERLKPDYIDENPVDESTVETSKEETEGNEKNGCMTGIESTDSASGSLIDVENLTEVSESIANSADSGFESQSSDQENLQSISNSSDDLDNRTVVDTGAISSIETTSISSGSQKMLQRRQKKRAPKMQKQLGEEIALDNYMTSGEIEGSVDSTAQHLSCKRRKKRRRAKRARRASARVRLSSTRSPANQSCCDNDDGSLEKEEEERSSATWKFKRVWRQRGRKHRDKEGIETSLSFSVQHERRYGDDSNSQSNDNGHSGGPCEGGQTSGGRRSKDSGSASRRLREGFGSSSGSGGSDEGDDEGHPWRRNLGVDGHHEPDDVMYGDDDDLFAFFHNTKQGMCTSSPDNIRGIILHNVRNVLRIRRGKYRRQPQDVGGEGRYSEKDSTHSLDSSHASVHLGSAYVGTHMGVPWGQWVVCKTLGSGSSGICMLCRDLATNQLFCAKKIFWAKFRLEEVQALMRLVGSNAHFVQVYGLLAEGADYLILMQYAGEVESIAECVRDDPMSELTALTILRRLVSALCVLANRGIIHNDLSAHNVMVRGLDSDNDDLCCEGIVVIDFGAAEMPMAGQDFVTTAFGCLVGTLANSSPERARYDPYTYSSDVWSCACVFYHALTGRELMNDKLGIGYEKVSAMFMLGNVTDATHAQFFDDVDLSRFHIRVREILIGCWQANPLTRPSLIGLLDMIDIAVTEIAAEHVLLPSPPELFLPTPEVPEGILLPLCTEKVDELLTLSLSVASSHHLLDNINQFPPEFFVDAGLVQPGLGDEIHGFPPSLEQQSPPVVVEAAVEGGGDAVAQYLPYAQRNTEPREVELFLAGDMTMFSISSSTSETIREAEEQMASISLSEFAFAVNESRSRPPQSSRSLFPTQAELMKEMHREMSNIYGNDISGYQLRNPTTFHRTRTSSSVLSNQNTRRVDRLTSRQEAPPVNQDYLVYFWYGNMFVATVNLSKTTVFNERSISLYDIVRAALDKIRKIAGTSKFKCYLLPNNSLLSNNADLNNCSWPVSIEIRAACEDDAAHTVFDFTADINLRAPF